MKKRKIGRKAFRKDPIKAASLWQKAANEGLRPISKREQELILAEDRGYEQAEKDLERAREILNDDLMMTVVRIVESNAKLGIAIADMLNRAKP